MAKRITLTEEQINDVLKELESKLKTGKPVSESITIKPETVKDKTAYVWFTPKAWTKTFMLVDKLPGEVGWYGVTQRLTNEIFLVSDILVYPQTVTSVTVETDPVELGEWQFNLPDEQYENLRFQGHSHVNMAVTPSSTDKDNRELLMSQHKVSDESEFYFIFAIFNKDKKISGEIYDFANNIIYENGYITFEPIDDDMNSLSDWVDESMKLIKKPVTTTPAKTVGYTSTYTSSSKKNEKKNEKKKSSGYNMWYDDDSYYNYYDDRYLGGYYNGNGFN